jgi:hypothetical protein
VLTNSQKLSGEKRLSRLGFNAENGTIFACSGLGLKNLLQAGRQWLELHVHLVNSLNVFPVPDGDTGTNMLLTMRSALEYVETASNQQAGPVAQAAAHGALMGARGNSGVILSQFLQGLALTLAEQAVFTAEDLARATELGAEKAYQSMVEPVEGTILTVAREAAVAARQLVDTGNQDLVLLLAEIVGAAQWAQANTPHLLPVLKEAGVTDSGGQGLVYILEGALRFMRHQPVTRDSAQPATPRLDVTLDTEQQDYGYDVQFLIRGKNLDVTEIRAQISALGQSTVVVGDAHIVKVHLHAADPGLPLSLGASQGVLEDVIVENLGQQAQTFGHNHAAGRAESLASGSLSGRSEDEEPSVTMATISVVPGDGLARIFESLGVERVLPGGQTMNPSTQELLEAVDTVQAGTVLILPNNKNAILAARQAAILSSKKVCVIPTKTVPEGIAALLSFNHRADLATNIQRMRDAGRQVETIEVARAVRDSTFNGFTIKSGDVIGFLNNSLSVVGKTVETVVLDSFGKINVEAFELVTIYVGQDNTLTEAEKLAQAIKNRYSELEIDVHHGGQSHYHYIISLE